MAGSRTTPCLLLVGASLAAACVSRGGAVPQPFPRPGPPAAATAPAPRALPADVYAITSTALSLRGVPYRVGGTTPTGFDCSGFTRYVFARHGITLPRLAADQYQAGHAVNPQDLQAGDLVFFTTIAPGASHVGMVIGGNEFVHAPSERGEVRVERLSASYWSRRYVGARRMVE